MVAHGDSLSDIREIDLGFSPDLTPRDEPSLPQAAPLPDEAEVWEALVLGTRDYLAKTGFTSAYIGLSGGIDSSVVAAIAVDALGPENVTGVSMPSRYSSDHSRSDAHELAQNLGIELLTIPIEPAHAAMLEMLEEPFAGAEPGLAEENLQSRQRGNILMSLANKFRALVLTTGNKSEMATGYATLYGDMAGGFAVLKDVPKTLTYAIARWRNAAAGRPLIPQAVLDKPPSAELRPDQFDADSLPPYDILDPILEAYVEGDRSGPEIVAMGFDEAHRPPHPRPRRPQRIQAPPVPTRRQDHPPRLRPRPPPPHRQPLHGLVRRAVNCPSEHGKKGTQEWPSMRMQNHLWR